MKTSFHKNLSPGTGFKGSSARFLAIAGVCLGMAGGVMAQDGTNQPVASVKSARPENLSFAADEVVKLFSGGVDQKVIATYVQNSTHPYQLSANDIVYLHDTGVSSELITAMMRHDQERPQPTVAVTPAPAAPAPTPTYVQPTATAPTVVYANPPVYQTAPVYVSSDYYPYSYGYSSYPYYYGGPVRIGVGLGFGFGHVGFGFGHGGGFHGGGGFHHH